jgi:hypothetical protein
MKMEQTECSETSAHKIQKPGNNLEESIKHLEHGESLKSGSLETSKIVGFRLHWPAGTTQTLGKVRRHICPYIITKKEEKITIKLV